MQRYKNVPLSKYTTLQIGGNTKEFITVQTQEELVDIVKQCHQNHKPYLVIGRGSNLLVADEGVDFLVIKNETKGIIQETGGVEEGSTRMTAANEMSEDVRGDTGATGPVSKIIVKSGTLLQDLVDYSIKNGLSGLQKLTGIPGTVGGAVFGNAGAYGQTISDHITEVVCFDGKELFALDQEDCEFKYRYSYFKKAVYTIVEVHFQLKPADSHALQEEAANILSQRLVRYPLGIMCPGSFFKNLEAEKLPLEVLAKIPKDKIVYGKVPAGYLLEAVGAKGASLGNIHIADYHGNLFINKEKGTAHDFYTLAEKYAEKVKEKFGISLEPEVQLIGLPSIH